MDNITHEMRLAHWKSVIEECLARPEGQSAKQWLKEKDIPEKTYYYWQRRVRKEAYALAKADSHTVITANREHVAELPAVSFAEIPYCPAGRPADDGFVPTVLIRKGGAILEISNAVSDRLLERIMEVTAHA